MINNQLKAFKRFSIKFYETVFQSSGDALEISRMGQEAAVYIFGMIGLGFAALCVLASMSSTAREPSI